MLYVRGMLTANGEIKRGGKRGGGRERKFRAERGGGGFVWLGQGNETAVRWAQIPENFTCAQLDFAKLRTTTRINMNERLTHATRVRVQHAYMRAYVRCLHAYVCTLHMYITTYSRARKKGGTKGAHYRVRFMR